MIPHIDAALLAGCYIAIIALYVWTFKAVQEVRDMHHKHETEADKHVKSEDLVYKDVCQLQVKRFEEQIQDVKKDVKDVKSDINDIKTGMNNGFERIAQLIKGIT